MITPSQPITTRNEFHQALRDGFAEIARVGCREIWMCDDDFADWPLNERAVVDSLTQWAKSRRTLTVIARTFEEFPSRHSRWVEWRRAWSHVVVCRALEEAEADEVPTLLLAPGVLTVRLFDSVHHRGGVSRDPIDAVQNRELVDVLSQRSIEAFPATQLGL